MSCWETIYCFCPLFLNYNDLSKLSLSKVTNGPRKFTSVFVNVIYRQIERVYWSAVRRPVCPPHSEDWFHYLYAARRPPAPTGTMKVREDWNACGRQGRSVRWGGETRVPGSQARNASTSNKACSPPFTPFLPGPLEVPSQARNFSWISLSSICDCVKRTFEPYVRYSKFVACFHYRHERTLLLIYYHDDHTEHGANSVETFQQTYFI